MFYVLEHRFGGNLFGEENSGISSNFTHSFTEISM